MTQLAAAVCDCLQAVASPILVLQTTHIVWANRAACALIGCESDALLEMEFADLLAPASRDSTGGTLSGEFELMTAGGETVWVQVSVNPLASNGQTVEVATITDIRQRKLLEQTLNQRPDIYRGAIEAIVNGFYLLQSQYDANGQIADFIFTDVNAAGESIIPAPKARLLGRRVSEIFPHEKGHQFLQQYLHVAVTGQSLDEEFQLVRLGGELHWFHHQVIAVEGGVAVFIRDISDRKATETALLESEVRYRLISELISDYAYSFRVEPDGTLIQDWVTESFTRITGYRREELVGEGRHALFHSDDSSLAHADAQRVIRGETVSAEYRIVTKGGETRWVNILRQPIWDADHTRVIRLVGVAQDITERKQSEEELRKSEEQYRLIAENASDIITRASLEGIYTYASSACRTLLGYEPDEIVGKPVISLIHADEHPTLYAFFTLLAQSAEPLTITCRVQRKRGDYGWFEFTAQAIRDPITGQALEYISVARDISQRKQMESMVREQERLRYELQKEHELNEVKSNLMRTISHEFRTPLALIITATDLLDKYVERLDAAQRSERFQAIRIQVKHLSDMLDDITFVVQGTLHHMSAHPSRINLEAYCRDIVEEIQMSIGREHQILFTTDGQLREGIADKALIVRIITNLLSNAVKYSPEQSAITVSLSLRDDNAVLEVRDQGMGIEPDEQKRIFEPFYRGIDVLDRIGGTGLGLSIVKDCVNLHRGTITVDSEPGKGTAFIVRLPQTTE